MTIVLRKEGAEWVARRGEYIGRGHGPLSAVHDLFRQVWAIAGG